jgi:hypothetical protein
MHTIRITSKGQKMMSACMGVYSQSIKETEGILRMPE